MQLGLDAALQAITGAQREVLMAAPYLSLDVATALAEAATRSKRREGRFLTALKGDAVRSGFLSVHGLRVLAERFELRSLLNLHAKLIVVDASWGLLGSGNFTASGLDGGNVELGVVLTKGQASRAAELFEQWWSESAVVSDAQLRRAEREVRGSRTQRRDHWQGYGGRFRVSRGSSLAALRDRRGDLSGRGLWLKPVHLRPGRDSGAWWQRTEVVTDPHWGDGQKPRGRPGYEVDDLVLVYVADSLKCPALLRVTELPGFEPENAQHSEYEGDERYGWFTSVVPVVGVDLPVAPSLDEIGVARSLVQRRTRLRLTPHQMDRARQRLLEAAGLEAH